MSDNIQERVIELVARGVSSTAICDKLGISFSEVVAYTIPEVPKNCELGRESLRRFIIAVKKVGEVWPNRFKAAIDMARLQYDAGVVEMFQGREGDYIIQYAKARVKPITAGREYFSSMEY